jgi:hypothetical protein
MADYNRHVTISSPKELVFDSTKKILINAGYEMQRESPPNLLVVEKKKTREYAVDDARCYYSIIVTLNGIDQETGAYFDFKRYGIGQWKETTKKAFDDMIQAIISDAERRFMQRRSSSKEDEVIIHREKIIERQIVKVRCRYCGALNEDGLSMCQSCGARL